MHFNRRYVILKFKIRDDLVADSWKENGRFSVKEVSNLNCRLKDLNYSIAKDL